jgi:hypothetical protein
MGLDTKTYWLTDRQSQYDFDFDLSWGREFATGDCEEKSREFCTWGCENITWAREAEESPLLGAVVRERLVKAQHAIKGLAGAVAICELWRLAVAL